MAADDAALRQRARALVAEYVGRARGLGIPVPEVEVAFDLRGMAAGQAHASGGAAPRIRLNRVLLRENGEAFLAQTVPHEVAHVAVFYLPGRRRPARPHGAEWRRLMRHFGVPPERTHAFDVARARTRRLRTFRYACACSEVELTSIRHNRVRRGVRYHCRRCGGRLRPVG